MKKEKTTIKCLISVFILFIMIVIGIYIFNFRNSTISNNPSDWGVLGDYLGGMLNPLISLITLFFLIKTYLSQKEELHQSEVAAEEQRKISQKTANIQLLNTKISAAYEIIAIYRGEMEGITKSTNNNMSYTAIDGNIYYSDAEQRTYRKTMADKITQKLNEINKLLDETKL